VFSIQNHNNTIQDHNNIKESFHTESWSSDHLLQKSWKTITTWENQCRSSQKRPLPIILGKTTTDHTTKIHTKSLCLEQGHHQRKNTHTKKTTPTNKQPRQQVDNNTNKYTTPRQHHQDVQHQKRCTRRQYQDTQWQHQQRRQYTKMNTTIEHCRYTCFFWKNPIWALEIL